MKNLSILFVEIVLILLMECFGLTGRKFLLVKDTRSSILVFGIILMLFCTISVGKFISAAPAHPLTILGYLFGTVAMITFLAQAFQWKLPVISNPKTAVIIFGAAILAKSILARCYPLLTHK